MNNLVSYLNNERNSIANSINEINEKINKSKYELENIEKKIVEHSKNVDTTYEIFSPNAYDKDYYIIEIQKLNQTKNEISKKIESMLEEENQLLKQQRVIELAYEDYVKFQQHLFEEEVENKRIMEKKINELNLKHSNEIIQVLEYQINKDNHFLSDEVVRQLDIIKNKLSLCENFVDMDINRAKLEMLKTAEEVSYFKKRLDSEMFHVKHFDSNSRLNLNSEIKKFINQYKKSINAQLEYNYIGRKIEDSSYNIVNLIRIIKESIDNADNHANGTNISVTVIVEDNKLNDDYFDDYDIEKAVNNQKESIIDISMFNARRVSKEEKYEDSDLHEFKKNADIDNYNLNDEDVGLSDNSLENMDIDLINNSVENKNKDLFSNNIEAYETDSDFFSNCINNDETNNNLSNSNENDELFNTVLSDKANKDMHQINFIIDETTDKFNVIIKISDNGDGFNLYNENMLIENGLFGIYMMKYRTKKINGKFHIQSDQGIGTTVTIIYQAG